MHFIVLYVKNGTLYETYILQVNLKLKFPFLLILIIKSI